MGTIICYSSSKAGTVVMPVQEARGGEDGSGLGWKMRASGQRDARLSRGQRVTVGPPAGNDALACVWGKVGGSRIAIHM